MKLYGYSQTSTTANLNRVLLVLDRQANGAAPIYGDIITGGEIDDFTNLNNRRRFRILWDKVFSSPKALADEDGYYLQRYIRFPRGINVQYNTGVTGTVADVMTNALWLMVICDGSGSNYVDLLDLNVRIRYTDS